MLHISLLIFSHLVMHFLGNMHFFPISLAFADVDGTQLSALLSPNLYLPLFCISLRFIRPHKHCWPIDTLRDSEVLKVRLCQLFRISASDSLRYISCIRQQQSLIIQILSPTDLTGLNVLKCSLPILSFWRVPFWKVHA
jgi:hypothetical protein